MRSVSAKTLTCACILAAALPASVWAANKPFKFGIASGDPSANSVLLWTRSNEAGPVRAEVSKSPAFKGGARRFKAQATAENDLTVRVVATGLAPGSRYYYRFNQRGQLSPRGSFQTLPRAGGRAAIKLVYSGDSDGSLYKGKPAFNNFEVLEVAKRERPTLFVYLGDLIYSDGTLVKADNKQVKLGPTARSVKAKWAKYRQNRGYKHLRSLLAAVPVIASWDDHEVINDWSPGTVPASLVAAGRRALMDYFPIRRYSNSTGLYRTFAIGKLAQVFVLDQRSFRSDEAYIGGKCDNPAGSGQRDLAPTAPQTVRDAFGALVPSLKNPAPAECLAAINDPSRTFLGSAQLQTFLNDLKESKATWKLVMNPDPIQQLFALPYDRWEGYAAERKQVLDFINSNGIKNVVWLTTDMHGNVLADVRYSVFPSMVSTGMKELVTGPIATNTFLKEVNAAVGSSFAGGALQNAFFKPVLAVDCTDLDRYSYGLVEIAKSGKKLKLTSKDDKGKKVCSTTLTAS